MLHLVLFLMFGAICVAGAVNLLVQRHPINSALSLIVVMGSLAVEYLLLGAEFVAAVQVIIYAGAIMVLFVFVIMLLNAGEEELTSGSRVALLLGIPGMLVSSVLVAWVLLAHSPDWRYHLHRTDNPWYPTMRLFRQPSDGDWAAVIAEVAAALARGPGTRFT